MFHKPKYILSLIYNPPGKTKFLYQSQIKIYRGRRDGTPTMQLFCCSGQLTKMFKRGTRKTDEK